VERWLPQPTGLLASIAGRSFKVEDRSARAIYFILGPQQRDREGAVVVRAGSEDEVVTIGPDYGGTRSRGHPLSVGSDRIGTLSRYRSRVLDLDGQPVARIELRGFNVSFFRYAIEAVQPMSEHVFAALAVAALCRRRKRH
jgi:hypothetical protein